VIGPSLARLFLILPALAGLGIDPSYPQRHDGNGANDIETRRLPLDWVVDIIDRELQRKALRDRPIDPSFAPIAIAPDRPVPLARGGAACYKDGIGPRRTCYDR
jgi:hypothetical protein